MTRIDIRAGLEQRDASTVPLKPSKIGVICMILLYAGVVALTLTLEEIRSLIPQYLRLELVFIILFTAMLWKPKLPLWLIHFYFVLQAGLILLLHSWWPEFDIILVLFMLLSYQASLLFTGRVRWVWIIVLVLLTGASLIFHLGSLEGLARAPTTMAGVLVIPAYLIVNHEIEHARLESELLLVEVQEMHQRLEAYASQAEQLAAMQERNRLARELHDNVSQLIFSISLTARSAQLLLEREPARVPEQINILKQTTADALSQLRSLITQLHPPPVSE